MEHEKIERCAEAAYDVLNGYDRLFDRYTCETWHQAPAWRREELRAVVRFALESGSPPTVKYAHRVWVEHRRKMGWTWGPIEDNEYLRHPNMLHFEQLPPWERVRVVLMVEVILATAEYCDVTTAEEGAEPIDTRKTGMTIDEEIPW